MAQLYAHPDGDQWEPIYEQLKAEWEAVQKVEKYRLRKKAEAAEIAMTLIRRGTRRFFTASST